MSNIIVCQTIKLSTIITNPLIKSCHLLLISCKVLLFTITYLTECGIYYSGSESESESRLRKGKYNFFHAESRTLPVPVHTVCPDPDTFPISKDAGSNSYGPKKLPLRLIKHTFLLVPVSTVQLRTLTGEKTENNKVS
jgi:hypothetical protein